MARPWLALAGGGLAILGHLIRIAVSVAIEVRPDFSVDGPIVGSIVLMFAGLAVPGVATLRGGRLNGWPSRVPLLVLAGGLIAAPFYTIDKVVHFILLGLLSDARIPHVPDRAPGACRAPAQAVARSVRSRIATSLFT